MSIVNAEIKWQSNDDAWFTTNAAEVFAANIQIFHVDGRYKFTDGVTALSALSFLGGGSGVQSVTGPQVDDTDPLNPIIKPIGLIQIIDKQGDFFTDLATATTYIEQFITPGVITDKSFNEGIFFFTVPYNTQINGYFLIDNITPAVTSASLIDKFGLLDLTNAQEFGYMNAGHHILGNGLFQNSAFNLFSGTIEMNSLYIEASGGNFGQSSTGKFIIKGSIGINETAQFGVNFFLNSTATIFANASKYTSNAGGIHGDLQTAITNGCNVQFDGIDLEKVSNKSTSVVTDQASNIKYPSVKSVYDWATSLFARIGATQTFSGVNTFSQAIVSSSETASTIASFDASKNIKSLALATYPSLTELSYGKGVTSSIQTQLNNKGNSQPIYSGKWRTIPYVGIPTTATGNQGTIFYIPYIVSSTHTVTDIGIEVTTAAVFSTVSLALYSDNNGAPGTLIEQSGNLLSNTTGLKTYTFASPIVLSASNQVYWMAVQASASGIGLRVTSTAVCNFYVSGTGGTGSLYTQTQAFGTFPATATPTIFTASSSYVPVLKAQ